MGRPSASKGPQVWPQGSEEKSKIIENIENFGTDLRWFGNHFGTVWGYFRTDFGPVSKKLKFESSELKN